MRVLWLCNMPLPEAAKVFGIVNGTGGGWLSAEFDLLRRNNDIETAACFPLRHTKKIRKELVNGTPHYSVPRRIHSFFRYDATMEPFFREIVNDFKPDVIHIHGTENTPAWSLMKACPEYTYVVSLQGIISMIAVHNHACLPYHWQKDRTLMDFVSHSAPLSRAASYRNGGKYEAMVIQNAQYVLGRTYWDRACAEMLGMTGQYVHAPELLRPPFYRTHWDSAACEKLWIFSSAASTSIKGAHFLLEAVAMLKPQYPEIKLCFAGNRPGTGGLRRTLRRTGYEVYITRLIRKLGLQDNVCFMGRLTAEQMCEQMRLANVYVHPSAIDNSPNALAEAMMVGTPCVASYAGGIPSMLNDGTEGLLYQYDAPYMLAYQIKRIFDSPELANSLSEGAKARAARDHSEETADITLNLYRQIVERKTK